MACLAHIILEVPAVLAGEQLINITGLTMLKLIGAGDALVILHVAVMCLVAFEQPVFQNIFGWYAFFAAE